MSRRRTLEEFKRDYSRTGKIMRPNPDWEEDLLQTAVVTPEIEARVRSYTQGKEKKEKIECVCQEKTTSPGVAPLIDLNDGHTMPSFGLGTWLGFDEKGELIPVKDASMQIAVEMAIEAGYRLIDTASIYNTEDQVGQAIKNCILWGLVSREDVFVVTKLWNDAHAKKAVIPALKKSLEKMELQYVDLYLMHFPIAQRCDGSYEAIDYLETWEGMIEAKGRGLCKSIGVSNFNITQLDRLICFSKVKPAVLQVEINLNLQQPELLTFCKKHNIAVMAYTPFGSLFHNRAAKDAPKPRTDEQALLRMSDRHHKTIPQIALRYLIELGVIPIPKSIKKKRIQQNIEVFDFQLSCAERQLLKNYDKNYRTISVPQWKSAPNYPFH